MITDSHCHLASARFSTWEREEIIDRAMQAGVHRMVTLSTCLEDLGANLEIADHPRVMATMGIHPCDVHNAPDDVFSQLAQHAPDPRICAIGETGLDYFHPAPQGWDEGVYRVRQRDFLEGHFELAASSGLNVVVHTRDKEGRASFEDALAIYKRYSAKVRAVFHCFSSEWELAEKVISEGGLVSFGGVATFRNADLVRESVRCATPGSFMFESDSPYLAPEPFRGKRNEPAFVMHVAEAIAAIRGESIEEISDYTERAVDSFFTRRN